MIHNKTDIKHLAVVLDGNGRWAALRGLPKIEGHRAGVEAVQKLIQNVADLGIPYLTIYSLSAENLKRPKEEVSDIMGLCSYFLSRELKQLHESGVRIRVVGNLSKFSKDLQEKLRSAEELTKNNKNLTLCPALGYGSRAEIAEACAAIVKSGIAPEQVTEQTVASHLYDPDMPDVDLFVRPGDHIRMSNFLLWQSAYAELFFTKVLWPDFDKKDLDEAVSYFSSCKRNFGYSRDQETR